MRNRQHYNEYQNAYQKKRWQERRKKAIEYLGNECSNCGLKQHLEFDHINAREKLFTVAEGSNFSEERFWNEVKKCQLLCSTCHKEKHKSKNWHGLTGYRKKCRCDICREAQNTYMRFYKARKRKGNQ